MDGQTISLAVPQRHKNIGTTSELTLVDGMLYKGSRTVNLKSHQKQMPFKIHKGHLGIEKHKRRAWEVVFERMEVLAHFSLGPMDWRKSVGLNA